MNRIFFGILSLMAFATIPSYAQIRAHCATVEYSNKLFINGHVRQTDVAFEEWLRQKQITRANAPHGREKSTLYRIPVVVHVIHNGEPVGEGANIPDAQILSQIKVLNEDFRRENADAANTPDEFKAVAGKMNIEFILAKRDPDGLPTTGIVRVNGKKSQWEFNDNNFLKSKSYWPAEEYFNIWVCNLSDFLGYSQFPVSDLAGLENSSTNRLTDGVVILYKAFGSVDDGDFDLDPEYNRGRTATHEIGHCFGLRHIWGDLDDCTGTDYVDDTPKQKTKNSGCPTHPHRTCTPSVVNMFQNYMDYTDDVCMSLFTAGQISRMQTVLENSPRRASLLSSNALIPPSPVSNDIGFREVISPHPSQCNNHISPSVKLRNYGTNAVTSAQVRMKLNGVLIETRDLVLSLNPTDSMTVNFNSLDIAAGTSDITFEIILTNGVADGDGVSNDNIVTQTVFVPSHADVPFQQSFAALDQGWFVQNPDGLETWKLVSIPRDASKSSSMMMPFSEYDYPGEHDMLYSPVFRLDGTATLYFDVAYSKKTFSSDDGLKIVALTDCATLDQGTVIYDKNSGALETAGITNGTFTANSAKDWRTEQIDLSSFAGNQNLQLAFITTNGSGNNLFLDNVVVASALTDIKLNQIVSPSLVSSQTSSAKMLIQNTGTTVVHTVTVNVDLNNTHKSINIAGLNLQPGEADTVSISGLTFKAGDNLLKASLSDPDGASELFTENNSAEIKVIINTEQDVIPLRQDFEGHAADWIMANIGYGATFEFFDTGSEKGEATMTKDFNNETLGDESWLVSPLLDFSNVTEASVLYDLSYAEVAGRTECFSVRVSSDGGATYKDLPVSLPSQGAFNSAWEPRGESDWSKEQYLDLTAFAGQDSVRVAFVVTNANGNNLYLDNIEFFVSESGRTIDVNEGYSIFGYDQRDFTQSSLKVGFNLPIRQDVACEIIDVMGRVVSAAAWKHVLNQIFELPLQEIQGSGIYMARINIGGSTSTTRILVKR